MEEQNVFTSKSGKESLGKKTLSHESSLILSLAVT